MSWFLNKEHIPQLTNAEFKLKFLIVFVCTPLIHISIIFEFHSEYLQKDDYINRKDQNKWDLAFVFKNASCILGEYK